MAASYGPLGQTDDHHDDTQDENMSQSPFHAQSASPLSTTTSTSMTSPSSSAYLTLADQTFTPLSMGSSDYYQSEHADDDDDNDRDACIGRARGKAAGDPEQNSFLRTAGTAAGAGAGGARGLAQIQAPSAPPARRGPTIVSSMIQSFEALRTATTPAGYDLISATKNTGPGLRNNHNYGLISPPATLSPSPSLSPSPTTRQAPQSFSRVLNTNSTARDLVPNTLPALSIPPPPSSVVDLALSSVSADTTVTRPTPKGLTPRTASPSPTHPLPLIFRTASNGSVTINHPTPDIGKRSRSGAYLGNIAALEATAERLVSHTSSIEDAIREEHDELKRTDSRRSSILSRYLSGSDSVSVQGQPRSAVASRQNSILGTNSAARLGGYSPGGYIMSPHTSISGASARLRSASKASSYSPIAGNMDDAAYSEDALFMTRHGPGKSSVRTVASVHSLAQIAELDQPSALTKEAFEEADRAAAAGEDPEDDDTIWASAHQHIEEQFADAFEDVDMGTPQTEVLQPMLSQQFVDEPLRSPRLQLHQPDDYPQYREHLGVQYDDRPTTSGTGATYDQAQRAFGDFDGVHCDPYVDDFPPPQQRQEQAPEFPPEPRRASRLAPPRPKSYFDPSTGQQMLYYPAPVPAMLNLPPKLSKKPKGEAAARNVRRSQVLSAMPQAMPPPPPREPRVWLPDPVEGLHGSRDNLPFMTGLLEEDVGSPAPLSTTDSAPRPPLLPDVGGIDDPSGHARQASETSTIHAPQPPSQPQQPEQQKQQREIRRPQRLTEAEKRKTRATMFDELPPQLRASAFFDLPSTTPKIEVKDGSAMATLDSILDASASAPVSAFTDHAFAGKLGKEVYGVEKKKKKAKKDAAAAAADEEKDNGGKRRTVLVRKSSSDLLVPPKGPKKRASQLSLLGRLRGGHDDDLDIDEGRTTIGLVGGEVGNRRVSDNGSPDTDDQGPISPNQLAPDSDEESEESEPADEESENDEDDEDQEEEDLYQGPPTTLLAELQLRKQQNKLRTRPKLNANGLHTTLLELDTVAEMERKMRKGKQINLAWQDPNTNPDHVDDLDDDDVPLGMLYVAKAAGNRPSTMDISAIMNEVNRPLGLMERRELEDNEPLSARRARLQGRDGGLAPMSLTMMQKRMTQLSLAPAANGLGLGLGGSRSMSRLTLPLQQQNQSVMMVGASALGSVRGAGEEDEFEGETLAQRKARLTGQEDPLPRARPVSRTFSAELLSQFGPEEEEAKGDDNDKGKGKTEDNVPEEEETLGQRRRRLQAEREAREREMNAGGGLAPPMMIPGNRNTMLSTGTGSVMNFDGLGQQQQRLSHRLSMSDMLAAHPIDTPQGVVDPRTQERMRREAEAERVAREKDAKMAALRAQMPATMERTSTGARNGGYMGGVFNDGSGGIQQQQQHNRMSMAPTIVPVGGGHNNGTGGIMMPAAVGGMPYGAGVYGNGAAGMQPMTQQGQPVDMVERWRQSVMP
ncbi:hypothetical protein B0H66DRAFT_486514 [Apodospora peruviana]|uniref:Uncharacterized protein n=1 Tax=Apodospora peruviana TaxID=516989 RepID=A0AAE0HSC7_9PEZI|nr:hypothetical protein B0H66DRAFT_486514 [Apodospora peruviana]